MPPLAAASPWVQLLHAQRTRSGHSNRTRCRCHCALTIDGTCYSMRSRPHRLARRGCRRRQWRCVARPCRRIDTDHALLGGAHPVGRTGQRRWKRRAPPRRSLKPSGCGCLRTARLLQCSLGSDALARGGRLRGQGLRAFTPPVRAGRGLLRTVEHTQPKHMRCGTTQRGPCEAQLATSKQARWEANEGSRCGYEGSMGWAK